MISVTKKITVNFYRASSGKEPLKEWLFELTAEDRKNIGEDIKTIEFGWPIGMPVCRPLSGGLYEVRSTLTGSRIARIIFCIHESRMILLHGFIKKIQKTPDYELDIARKRQKEIKP